MFLSFEILFFLLWSRFFCNNTHIYNASASAMCLFHPVVVVVSGGGCVCFFVLFLTRHCRTYPKAYCICNILVVYYFDFWKHLIACSIKVHDIPYSKCLLFYFISLRSFFFPRRSLLVVFFWNMHQVCELFKQQLRSRSFLSVLHFFTGDFFSPFVFFSLLLLVLK